MKYLGLLFLLFSCSSINAQIDIPELDRLIKYGEVEPLGITFQKILYADEFIDTFKLSKQELEMVGYWTENYTVKLNQTSSGVRIKGIDIYPNRIMGVVLERIESGQRSQSLLFSLWKIESNALLIKPLFLINRGSDTTIFTAESSLVIDSQYYYRVLNIDAFEKAYVLREQLDFSVINPLFKNEKIRFGKDCLRYRILFEHAMPNIYQRIGTDKDLRRFILNPVYSDTEYFIELERSHSRFYKTEYQ